MNKTEKQTLLHTLQLWEQSHPQPLDPTFYTSFAFLTNALVNFTSGYPLYALLFTTLFKTSILWRLYPSTATFILDKLAINAVVVYGGYLLYQRLHELDLAWIALIVSTFAATIYLFYYGYLTETYCYDKRKTTQLNYHSLLHLISSFGHHLIVLA
jgi:hypothetical protein